MKTITLNSNMSNECVRLDVLHIGQNDIECAISIKAIAWDGDHEHDAGVTVASCFLGIHHMTKLWQDLNDWLESKDVGIESFTGEYPLAADDFAKFTLIFKDREDTISSQDKPVVTVVYSFGNIMGEFHFVTDQSCLNIFANNLRVAINNN